MKGLPRLSKISLQRRSPPGNRGAFYIYRLYGRHFKKIKKYAIITANLMKNITDNINFIKNTLQLLCGDTDKVKLIAVTKTFPHTDVSEAIKAGIKDIGESKIQEALPKFGQLGNELESITRHFIGHLQSNKAKKAVENFDLIHSLDSLKLAKDIDRHSKSSNKVQNCLIEVKVSCESAKSGVDFDSVCDFYMQCSDFTNIAIKGLMVITPLSGNPEDSRPYFKKVRQLFEKIRAEYNNADFNILSMGMSDDYKIAVEEGSNMVRIGSAIFGERDYGNK